MKDPIALPTLLLLGALAVTYAENRSENNPEAFKPVLTFEQARHVGEVAAQYAKDHEATPSVAVVDDGGHLLFFVRSEKGFAASANVAIGKARTSALFQKSTKDFEDIINHGRFTMTALPDFTPLQGGVPILQSGRVIGAIGVSGAKSAQQDEEVAKAGARILTDVKESLH